MQASFRPGAGPQNFVRFFVYTSLLLAAVVALATVIDRFLPSNQKAPRAEQARELAAQLSQKDWALDGESCGEDGIRLILEGNDLVAYPRGAPAIRHRILSQDGQQLTTRLNDRLVIFQVATDGFTYLDGGYGRWYRHCG